VDDEDGSQLKLSGDEGTGGCVFCRIGRHEVESHIVLEDRVSLAFLDRRPVFLGHTLLVTKGHYETLAELPKDLIAPLFSNAQLLARAVMEATGSDGSFVAINNRVSQSVPHLHVHVVPRKRGDGLRGFFWPRQAYKSEESALETQRAIKSALARLQTN
jgi:histidine triad (HIT) family protein